jgi:hypothetical protein
MRRAAMRTWALVAVALLTTGVVAGAAEGVKKTWTFEDDATGSAPRGFSPAVGEWTVVTADGGKVLAQSARNANPVFNVVLVDDTRAKDVDISVKVKALAGEYDQGGGLVWRARDAKNYYVARFNHKEDNFRVYKVVDGVRSQPFQNADVKHHDDWTVVRVTMKGDHIECYLDGKKYLDVHDATFPDAGKIGVWSKSDARSQFDDLTLSGD